MSDQFFKFLNPDGTTPQTGFRWPLPVGSEPGKWLPPISGELVMCRRGYHVVSVPQFWDWLGPELWIVDWAGELVRGPDKNIVGRARLVRKIETWNARMQRIFAADCAERVLSSFTKFIPNDQRPLEAIKAARRIADGLSTVEAESAARSVAESAVSRN